MPLRTKDDLEVAIEEFNYQIAAWKSTPDD